MDLIEKFFELIFFVPQQNPSKGVTTYRFLRIIVGIVSLLLVLITLIIPASLADTVDFTSIFCFTLPFMLLTLYIFRWFVVINRRYREARENEGREPSKGFTFYIGLFNFFLLLLTCLFLFGLYQRNSTETVNLQATNTALDAEEATQSSYETATAALWTPSNTPVPSTTPTRTLTPAPTTTLERFQLENELIFIPVAVLSYDATENNEPEESRFLTVIGVLYNPSDQRRCIYANDVKLEMDGIEYDVDTSVMSDIQERLTPRLDYIGGFLGHCVTSGEQEDTFVSFDVPSDGTEISLKVEDEEITLLEDWTDIDAVANANVVTLRDIGVTATIEAGVDSTKDAIQSLTENAQATNDAYATATATLWTHTPTYTPSTTPTPSNTPTITPTVPTKTPMPSPTASDTPTPSDTPTITPTRPTNTPRPTRPPETTTYYARENANVRSCAEIDNNDCPTVGSVTRNQTVQVIGTTRGDEFRNSTLWNEILYNGEVAYIHSSFLSEDELPELPTAVPQQVQPPSNNQQQPAANIPQPTLPPVQPTAPPVSEPQWSCSGDIYNCDYFNSCSAVMSYFNTCPGDPSRLDRDNDGIPCESLCGG